MIKKLPFIICGFFMLLMSGCGNSDEPENTNGLFDWSVTENIIMRETGKIESQKKYVVYDKTEEYMRQQKENFDSYSDKVYRWQYIYQKRN